MSSEHIRIESITGVDVDLEIAGVGSRSYAFLVDWHIRLILAFAWYLVATMAFAGGIRIDLLEQGPWVLPAAVRRPLRSIFSTIRCWNFS